MEKKKSFETDKHDTLSADTEALLKLLLKEKRSNERLQADLDRAHFALKAADEMYNKEIDRLREEGQKDLDGMREFQRKFIDADHEVRKLSAANDNLRAALVAQEIATQSEIERLQKRADWLFHNAGLLNDWAKEWKPAETKLTLMEFLEARVLAVLGE